MFGIICAGRPVQIVQQVAPDKYVFQIENGAKVNHMVVFVLPDMAIPPGMAASVYFQLPGKDFELLGGLSADKPSAIFKINGQSNVISTGGMADTDMMMDDNAGQNQDFTITVGVSIEPINVVAQAVEGAKQQQQQQQQQLQPAVKAAPTNANDIAALANKIVQHAYNFLSGYAGADGKVPMRVFDDWWNKFKTKLQNNPRFLDSLD